MTEPDEEGRRAAREFENSPDCPPRFSTTSFIYGFAIAKEKYEVDDVEWADSRDRHIATLCRLEKAEELVRDLARYHCDRGAYVQCGGCLPCRARAHLDGT